MGLFCDDSRTHVCVPSPRWHRPSQPAQMGRARRQRGTGHWVGALGQPLAPTIPPVKSLHCHKGSPQPQVISSDTVQLASWQMKVTLGSLL